MKAILKIGSFAYEEIKRALVDADQGYRVASSPDLIDMESVVLAVKPTEEYQHEQRIAIDFDGVIHAYTSPWTDTFEIHDGPVPGAFDFIRACFDEGLGVAIHTARANDPRVTWHIHRWLLQHGLEMDIVDKLLVTASKVAAIVYIDDRGYRFEGHWPSIEAIKALKQWNK